MFSEPHLPVDAIFRMSIQPEFGSVTPCMSGPNEVVTPPWHTVSMAAQQLILIDSRPADWRLDARTIERGKEGVKNARAALKESVARAELRRAAERDVKPAAA